MSNYFCTVVIPTFNTDRKRFLDLIDSLDSQTIGIESFEVIIADDGSTDGLPTWLRNIVSERPNYRLIELENSGWPCRPRNEAIKIAQGEFVLFMDHDDLVFPEFFARAQDLDNLQEVDIISPKELKTHEWYWAINAPSADTTNGRSLGVSSCMPMTPHKLYRTLFLRENNIFFIEDGRLLWEDVYFNVHAYALGARVGILASYPGYHWVQTGVNSSNSYGRDRKEFWKSVAQVLDYFKNSGLQEEDLNHLITHWYKLRVLDNLQRNIGKISPDEAAREITSARNVISEFIGPDLDHDLSTWHKLLSELFRSGDDIRDDLVTLANLKANFKCVTKVLRFSWSNGELKLITLTSFGRGESRLLLGRDRSNYFLNFGSKLNFKNLDKVSVYPKTQERKVQFTIRGRSDRQPWKLGIEKSLQMIPLSLTRFLPIGLFRISVDVDKFLEKIPNSDQPWDFAARVSGPMGDTHRGLRARKRLKQPAGAFIEGRQLVAYRNKSGVFTVDVGGGTKSIFEIQNGIQVKGKSCSCSGTDSRNVHWNIPQVSVKGSKFGKVMIQISTNEIAESNKNSIFEGRIVPVSNRLYLCVDKSNVGGEGKYIFKIQKNSMWNEFATLEVTNRGEFLKFI